MLLRDEKTGMRLYVSSRAGIRIRDLSITLGSLDREDERHREKNADGGCGKR